MLTNIKTYLDTVCEQIRFQKAHDTIKKELQDHINDQANAFVLSGMDKKTAIQKAIDEMGDPVLVGTELDRVHRPTMRWSFLLFVLLFYIASLATRWALYLASAEDGIAFSGITIRNIIGIFVSIAVIMIFYLIDFTILANRSRTIYTVYVALMAALYFYGLVFGANYNGNTYILGFVIPPLIYFFPVVLTALMYDCRGKSYKSILLCAVSFLIPALFSINTTGMTATVLIAGISFLLILYTIHKGWFAVSKTNALLMMMSIFVAFVAILFLFFSPYVVYYISRLNLGMVDFNSDWINNTLRHNIEGAHLFGVGDSFSWYTPDGEFVELTPEKQYLGREYFANYALHYFGWFIFLLFAAIYVFFIVKGFILAHKQKSQLGSMTAFAILLTISIIALWNIACTSGYFAYINPLELPFFSSGSTINTVYSVMMGILLSVFRTGKYTKDDNIDYSSQNSLFRLENNEDEITFSIHFKKRQKKIQHQKGEDLLE